MIAAPLGGRTVNVRKEGAKDYMLKISIITVVRNNHRQVEECINSVLSQNYANIEYILVDGDSTDGTLDVIKKYEKRVSKWISEPDQGIYDAMNKGIRLASGDVVGILNSDDFYAYNGVISDVMNEFAVKNVDSVFADLVYVKRDDPREVVRYYESSKFNPDKFIYGLMPAHPTFFLKRYCYEQYGLYRTNYKIAADYELLLRMFVKKRISYSHIPKVIIKMRTGGRSTTDLMSTWILNKEIVKACAENGIKTNYFKVYSKYFIKISQLFKRPVCQAY